MMASQKSSRLPVLVLAGLAASALPAMAQSQTTETIVETMRTLSGKQKARPSGAKGQCFTARFTPTAEAKNLTKSAAFSKESNAIVRFSVGSGNPKVADGNKAVNRGLALRIDPEGPGQSEFVMVNAPVNFVKSPEQMLAFLQARLPVQMASRMPRRSRPSRRPTRRQPIRASSWHRARFRLPGLVSAIGPSIPTPSRMRKGPSRSSSSASSRRVERSG